MECQATILNLQYHCYWMHQRLDKMMVTCVLPNCTASPRQSLESEQVLYLLLFSKWGILWLWEEIPGSEQQIRRCDREWTSHTLISVDFPAPSGKCFFIFYAYGEVYAKLPLHSTVNDEEKKSCAQASFYKGYVFCLSFFTWDKTNSCIGPDSKDGCVPKS